MTFSGSKPSSRETASACAAKASFDFDHVEIIDFEAGALEQLAHRGNRPHAHHRWLDAGVRVADDASERRQRRLFRPLRRSEDQRGGAVVDARRIAGGHRAILLERGFQRREPVQRRTGLRVLVDCEAHVRPAARDLDGQNLVAEAASENRLCRAPLALKREGVLIGARHPPARGDVLGGDAHDAVAEGVRQHADEAVGHCDVAHLVAEAPALQIMRGPAHHLRAAGQRDVGVAQHDALRRRDNRLHAAAAKPVERHCRGLRRHTRVDRRDAREIGVARAGRNDVAEHDMADFVGRDARAPQRFLGHDRAELGRLLAGQCAAEGSNRRSHARENHNVRRHIHLPFIDGWLGARRSRVGARSVPSGAIAVENFEHAPMMGAHLLGEGLVGKIVELADEAHIFHVLAAGLVEGMEN